MAIISLTTDWHHRDYYLGALKGRLLSLCPNAQLVDLSHNVDNFNTSQAAFILKNAFHHFPEGSIHIVGINSEACKDHPHVAVKYNGHYFIGADNGIFSLSMKGEPEEIVSIDNIALDESYHTFPELNIFTKAAAHIMEHDGITGLGEKRSELYRLVPIRAVLQKGAITGQIIYVDSFGNAITNVSKDLFESARQNREFEILVQSNHYRINTINNNYCDTPDGEILAIFNASGLLEIAINKGNLSELLQLDTNSDIRIKFHDH
jgi:S-adenosylmethionine hydrolase